MGLVRTIIRKAGTLIGVRKTINLIEGTNVTLTVADDPANDNGRHKYNRINNSITSDSKFTWSGNNFILGMRKLN